MSESEKLDLLDEIHMRAINKKLAGEKEITLQVTDLLAAIHARPRPVQGEPAMTAPEPMSAVVERLEQAFGVMPDTCTEAYVVMSADIARLLSAYRKARSIAYNLATAIKDHTHEEELSTHIECTVEPHDAAVILTMAETALARLKARMPA